MSSFIAVAEEESDDHWLQEFTNVEPLFNDEGYRSRRYRAPTPESMQEAEVLDTQQLVALLEVQPGIALINVLPLTQFGNDFVLKKTFSQIKGSIWLPNVGRGQISPAMERWFFNQLDQQTGGNKKHPVVLYCQADCWMSWNAIKRAAKRGYSQLYWYRNGMDGWREHALPVVEAIPESVS